MKTYKKPTTKYCADKRCNIILTVDNCYTSKRTRQDGTIAETLFPMCKACTHRKEREKRAANKKKLLTKKEKIIKVKKEKVTTLKKKLHKENVESIVTEPIIITPSRKLTGREQVQRVIDEQQRRKERTQKEINDEKNLYLDIGMRRCK